MQVELPKCRAIRPESAGEGGGKGAHTHGGKGRGAGPSGLTARRTGERMRRSNQKLSRASDLRAQVQAETCA